MGLFYDFSSRAKADSAGPKNRDSHSLSGSVAPRDPAIFDIENLAGRAYLGKRRGVSAGHPDLGAELGQLSEQRCAPAGIEMSDDLVE